MTKCGRGVGPSGDRKTGVGGTIVEYGMRGVGETRVRSGVLEVSDGGRDNGRKAYRQERGCAEGRRCAETSRKPEMTTWDMRREAGDTEGSSGRRHRMEGTLSRNGWNKDREK